MSLIIIVKIEAPLLMQKSLFSFALVINLIGKFVLLL